MKEFRISKKQLENVCLDCCDNLKLILCEKCAVSRLKNRGN